MGLLLFYRKGTGLATRLPDLDHLGILPSLQEVGAIAVGGQGVAAQDADQAAGAEGQFLGHVRDGLAGFGEVLGLAGVRRVTWSPSKERSLWGKTASSGLARK